MGELGERALQFHRDIGIVARRHADMIVAVGELARHYEPDRWYPTSKACADAIGQLVGDGDCILVKGSQKARMGRVAERLKSIGGADRGKLRPTFNCSGRGLPSANTRRSEGHTSELQSL